MALGTTAAAVVTGPVSLSCRSFSGVFAPLNGVWIGMPSHLDITRSLLTVGYASFASAIRHVGVWRAIALLAMMRGYITSDLRATHYFVHLEQSEKAAMSFLLAQAFTYWFAQSQMNLLGLVHVTGAKAHWTFSTSGTTLKAGAGVPSPKARPDFIGFDADSKFHVFETKGRSSKISAKLVKHALTQVSAIATVNGHLPETRVAACFSIEPAGVSGTIVDPPRSFKPYDLKFDESQAVGKLYAFFLDPDIRGRLVNHDGFYVLRLDNDLECGVDKKILDRTVNLIGEAREGAITVLIESLIERQDFYRSRTDTNVSFGSEGIFLRYRRREDGEPQGLIDFNPPSGQYEAQVVRRKAHVSRSPLELKPSTMRRPGDTLIRQHLILSGKKVRDL